MNAMQARHEDPFWNISELMRGAVGLTLPESKRPLVSARLGPRMRCLGLSDLHDYFELISGPQNGSEFQVAVDLLTTHETFFFREAAHFDWIARELQAQRPRRLRAWSAASSFGDEAYSLAMLLADLQAQGSLGSDWQVLGTDVSDHVLRCATQGIYPEERLRHVSAERLKRYCLRGEGPAAGMAQIQPWLRERVRFGRLNLCLEPPALGPFDLVLLRNVLIYFELSTKTEVVERVLSRLRPGGVLILGMAEGRVACSTPLQVLAPGVFRKLAP